METVVRRAALEDLDRIVALFEAYRSFYDGAPNETAARGFIRARLSEKDSVIFLAEKTNQAAGFMQLYPSFTSVGMARIWILNDLFVAQKHRRHGIACQLLKTAEAFAKETGAKKVILSTAVTNTAAQALYERHGWKRDTDFLEYVLPTPG
ncbi:MAG TPA: GNAT family N-acetyltransferase [Rhizomicrobium sp.]|nr:GNAT family N-acetyltransferase [Rhizomicrobium sp.]